jgi:polysaccharide chain length determinant protein (PEP-CTERM system associated)
MLPGKKYIPEDFVRIAWTRKWFIVIPTIIAAAGTFLWSRTLPDLYSSSTTILVVPQRVPESYVRSTVTVDVSERLQTISQQILSRTRLERIIEEFKLYENERKTMIMEDVVEQMRTRDIKISIATPRRRNDDATHFSVAYESSNPRTAMAVAERLASMFVQENLQDREILADSTNQFLQAQLEDAKRRLMEHEAKLEEFRQRNAGQLPTQISANLQMMQVTQAQIQSNIDAATRERDRLAAINTQIAETIASANQPAKPVEVEGTPVGTTAQQLEAARSGLQNMERRLKPTHPDIARAKRVIADLEAKVAQEAALVPAPRSAEEPQLAANVSPAILDKIASLRLEADQIRRSLDTRKRDDERLRSVLGSYSIRLDAAPKLETELTELMRDYDTIQEQYKSLLMKSEESKIAVNLERRQIGEQFKIIDGARLPQRPVSPDRLKFNMIGLAGGLGFGLALVVLLEYRDTTFKVDSDIVVSLALPVLAVIPTMSSAVERRRQKRRRVLATLSACAVVIAAAVTAAAWQLGLLRPWLP